MEMYKMAKINMIKRILIIGVMLSLIFCCLTVIVSATPIPKVGIYNPTSNGQISRSDGDFFTQISKFYQTEFFGDDIATNLTELKQRYDIIAVIDYESKISAEVENNFTQFVNDGGGLFVAGPLVGWKYLNGTKRPGYAFCKDVFGISGVGEPLEQMNITFDSYITNEKLIGNQAWCKSCFYLSGGEAFAWEEGAATILGVKNEYGQGRGVYFGSEFIGEGDYGKAIVNFPGRDEFILKILNWLAGENLSIPNIILYPIPNSHDSVVFWTIDDTCHYPNCYYKNFTHKEIFAWMGYRSAFQREEHTQNIKNLINNNTVVVGLHPTGECMINRNTSKTPEEVQNDTEQYITDCRNAWKNNLGYDTPITGWRSSNYGYIYDPGGDEKIPEYPAFINVGNVTWVSEFGYSSAGRVFEQFPFNIVANPGYGVYNNATTFSFLAYPTANNDGGYVGWDHMDEKDERIVGWADDALIPSLNVSLERHSPLTILSHAGVAFSCENGTKEVQKFLNYTRDKNVLFSDYDTFTNFWNAKNNINLSFSGGNITVHAPNTIRGLTLRSKENISSAKIGDNYLIFVKDDRVVLPKMKAGDTINLTIQYGSYNTSIPRISSITTTHPIYVLNATYNQTDKKVSLTLDLPYLYKSIYGSKSASIGIENFNFPFLGADKNVIFPNQQLTIYTNLSGEIKITSIDMSVKPSSLPVNITINDLSLPNSINFTASSTNGNNVSFTIYSLIPKGKYVIKRDGDYFITRIADSYGCIKFNNSEWLETYAFTVESMLEFIRFGQKEEIRI